MFELLVICEIMIAGRPQLAAGHVLNKTVIRYNKLAFPAYSVKIHGDTKATIIKKDMCQYIRKENEQ